MNTRGEFRGQPLMAFRTGAIVVAIVSGFYALAALLVGSPLEFGAALALCSACWVAADFIEWTVERERAAGRRPVPAALLNSGYGSSYPVRVGTDEYFRGRRIRTSLGWELRGAAILAGGCGREGGPFRDERELSRFLGEGLCLQRPAAFSFPRAAV
jgi:hypothetical protein